MVVYVVVTTLPDRLTEVFLLTVLSIRSASDFRLVLFSTRSNLKLINEYINQ